MVWVACSGWCSLLLNVNVTVVVLQNLWHILNITEHIYKLKEVGNCAVFIHQNSTLCCIILDPGFIIRPGCCRLYPSWSHHQSILSFEVSHSVAFSLTFSEDVRVCVCIYTHTYIYNYSKTK